MEVEHDASDTLFLIACCILKPILVNTNNCGQAHWHLRTDSVVHSFPGKVKVHIYCRSSHEAQACQIVDARLPKRHVVLSRFQRSMQQYRGGQKYSRGRQASKKGCGSSEECAGCTSTCRPIEAVAQTFSIDRSTIQHILKQLAWQHYMQMHLVYTQMLLQGRS